MGIAWVKICLQSHSIARGVRALCPLYRHQTSHAKAQYINLVYILHRCAIIFFYS